MRRLDWLTAEADASLLRVTVNVLIPCLILESILGNAALEKAGNVLLAPLVGFGTVVLGIALAWPLAKLGGLPEAKARRTFALATGIYNYGYVPLPLALALFDRETAGVLFVYNVGVEAALWTFGLYVLRGDPLRSSWRKIFTPPLAFIALALALNFSGLEKILPGSAMTAAKVLSSAIKMLGQCAIPLGLVLIGATIADHARGGVGAHSARVIAAASFVRMGILPVIFLLLAKFLPVSVELKRVIVLQAAMPAAVFPIVMAKHFGGDIATALRVVIGTSLVGFVTIPLWVRFGMKFVGL